MISSLANTSEFDRPFRSMEKTMNRVLRDFFGEVAPPTTRWTRSDVDWIPATDILNEKENLRVFLELPGVQKDMVNVNLDANNVLVISGNCPTPDHYVDQPMVLSERLFGKFERRLQLPAIRLKQDQVSAKMTDGILEVVVGKESESGKTIQIQ